MKTSLMIGRWQPLHKGHIDLINTVLNEGNRVVVGVRNTELSDQNPYTMIERMSMIETAFRDKIRDNRVEIVPVPDLDEIVYGRAVGYDIREVSLPEDVEAISGTRTREDHRIVWLTGNTGAGKTTLANGLKRFYPHAIILDGDEMRDSISKEFGLTLEDRLAHNRRVARLARTLAEQTKVIVAVIAPTPLIRGLAEKEIGYPPVWCWIKNDNVKSTLKKPYEPPENPAVVVDNTSQTIEQSVVELHTKLTQL